MIAEINYFDTLLKNLNENGLRADRNIKGHVQKKAAGVVPFILKLA